MLFAANRKRFTCTPKIPYFDLSVAYGPHKFDQNGLREGTKLKEIRQKKNDTQNKSEAFVPPMLGSEKRAPDCVKQKIVRFFVG